MPNYTRDELEELLEAASEKGAKKALASIGLQDERAAEDVHDLRELLDGWRSTKRTVIEAILRWVTVSILAAISAYFVINWRPPK